jgi:hypothetical protein
MVYSHILCGVGSFVSVGRQVANVDGAKWVSRSLGCAAHGIFQGRVGE